MPARTGAEYIKGLRDRPREVWISGERVKDVTAYPGFSNGALSIAALYDMQHDPALKEEMTYTSPTTGDRVGLSFIVPRTMDDLERRGRMMAHWARAGCGMMGRAPDFLNANMAGFAGAADYFQQNRPEFKDNVLRYYEYIRENDLTLTHTLINLQRSRTGPIVENPHEEVALTITRETDAGIVVKGARVLATLGPLSDEIAVYPARIRTQDKDASRFAFAFAIPCDTTGLKFVCRESFDLGRSHFDHPLASRFEEMDTLVFFDDVLVPWERVFLLGDIELCNNVSMGTGSFAHTGHQVVTREATKAEFVLGLASLMVETLGSGEQPHVQERIGELIMYMEMMKAMLRTGIADAALDQWGVMRPSMMPLIVARNLFSRMLYPRMSEIIQLLGSSSLMAAPSEGDFDAEVGPELERYLATDTATARDRAKLFHLAWDTSLSAFGARQLLYERFFGGDPVANALMLNSMYDKGPMMERVREFLAREDEEELWQSPQAG